MTPAMRDRLTGGIAIAAVVGLFLWYGMSVYFDEAGRLQNQIKARQAEVDELQKQVNANRRVAARLGVYREKSLPPQYDEARARYQEWLLEQVQGVKLGDMQIVPVNSGGREQQGGFKQQLGFNVTGRGTLAQVVDLFHRLYSVDLLQRLKRVSLKPIRESRDLDISLTIEALSLSDADPVKPGDKPKVKLAGGDLKAYEKVILDRNLLGPANRPPKLESIGSQRGTRNQSVSFTVRAKDTDELDKLKYSLEPGAPNGARIDPQTGAFRWTAGSPGDYPVTIRVTDDGFPAKTDIAKVTINVGDPPPPPTPRKVVEVPPPPPKPNLDLGKLAFVTALTELDGRPQVWISVRSTGEVLQLLAGDKWQINGLSGVVKHVGAETVEMELIDKKRYAVRLGDNLSQAFEVKESKTALPTSDP